MKEIKKLLALLMAATLLVCAVSGCASDSAPQTTDDTQAEEFGEVEEIDESATAPVEEPVEREAFCHTSEEFQTNIEKLINKDDYRFSDDDIGVNYVLPAGSDIEFDLDGKVQLDDGTVITLPTTHLEMVNLGWNPIEEDPEISKQFGGFVEYVNADGTVIMLTIAGDYDADEEAMIPLEDCTIDGVILSDDLNGGNIPGFSVCDGVTQDYQIAEVIEKLGSPTMVTYMKDSKWISLSYIVELDNGFHMADFVFDAESGYMIRLNYN